MRYVSAVVLFLLLSTSAVAESLSGTWTATVRGDGWMHMNFSIGRRMNMGVTLPYSSLAGVSAAALQASSTTPVAFSIEREAGTVQMEGTVRQGKGSGHLEFEPNRGFDDQLKSIGVRMKGKTLDDETLFLFTVHSPDSPLQLIREIQGLGYRDLDIDDVIGIVIHRITPEYVREVRALQLGELSLRDLTSLRIHGVSAAYVREMRAAGFPRPDKDDVISWRIHNVTPAFVREIRDFGYRDADTRDLLSMSMHGVRPDFIRELRDLGFENLSVDRLVSLRIHGVTPEFIREMRTLGYDVPAEELQTMRIHGVTPSLVRRLREAGYENLSVEKLIQIRIHGLEDVLLSEGDRR